jgi:hypothetical protein
MGLDSVWLMITPRMFFDSLDELVFSFQCVSPPSLPLSLLQGALRSQPDISQPFSGVENRRSGWWRTELTKTCKRGSDQEF